MTVDKSIEITQQTLEKINVHAVKPLTENEVYCFSVLLCDNDVDRDYERFSAASLKTLAELYIGRTGIFDHNPKGENQTARIYDTVVKEYPERKTAAGEAYAALMGYAYMVRTPNNSSLIAEIDGGIKKEVSVSCSVESKICSVCGADMMKNPCVHVKGKYYGERLCFQTLENPSDAYEWSFVAVPAQRNAGVAKRYCADNLSTVHESDEREKLAIACENIRGDILKLSYFTKPFHSVKSILQMTEDMDIYSLIALKKRLEEQTAAADNSHKESFITAAENDNNEFML